MRISGPLFITWLFVAVAGQTQRPPLIMAEKPMPKPGVGAWTECDSGCCNVSPLCYGEYADREEGFRCVESVPPDCEVTLQWYANVTSRDYFTEEISDEQLYSVNETDLLISFAEYEGYVISKDRYVTVIGVDNVDNKWCNQFNLEGRFWVTDEPYVHGRKSTNNLRYIYHDPLTKRLDFYMLHDYPITSSTSIFGHVYACFQNFATAPYMTFTVKETLQGLNEAGFTCVDRFNRKCCNPSSCSSAQNCARTASEGCEFKEFKQIGPISGTDDDTSGVPACYNTSSRSIEIDLSPYAGYVLPKRSKVHLSGTGIPTTCIEHQKVGIFGPLLPIETSPTGCAVLTESETASLRTTNYTDFTFFAERDIQLLPGYRLIYQIDSRDSTTCSLTADTVNLNLLLEKTLYGEVAE